ncbi:TetR/AcrR family transcriptional regulator [Amycolatopsis suaedae]|uniref:TetR/AcrR family transcriptional regulator n=1 Tax=Amycolatopsis suaedae TaxID=2510978 RepID=A0A4Q7J252_9PSEU|nr:TetR/AcrR family transcriptional regulator [Amycolatopsis suaedae]RZQ60957.1 TetR/AcrR family transcriptional regulator [Amycolatopsis suaedae]
MTAERLRERTKRQTRQLISDVATRLFEEKGFGNVTIAEIAAAAGVARMTVTNHFPLKEDLVFDRAEQLRTSLARTVAARAPGTSALEALRREYAERVDCGDGMLGGTDAAWARMVCDSPVLLARLRELYDQAEAELAAQLAAESGDDGIVPKIVAAQLAAVQRLLFHHALRRSVAGDSHDEILRSLGRAAEEAYAVLAPAIGDYGRA